MNSDPLLRLAIVSEQAIFLRGLESLVLSLKGVSLVGEARSAAEALQLCRLSEPGGILVDLKSPLEQRQELARQMHASWPAMRVVLLVDSEEAGRLAQEAQTEPLAYFSRDVSEEEFKAALTQVLHTSDGAAGVYASAASPPEERDADAPGLPRPRSADMVARELNMAGRIQADILPEEAPVLPGWDIAARLEPARETSGDFYDFLPLTESKWGILVADVTDKGMGAALFMALTSTLIRTYAARYPTLPAVMMSAVSERILSDTRGNMFITTFFGVLEPYTGRFIFVNAGHPPGYLISSQKGRQTVDRLRPTGMALGVSEKAQWKQKIARLEPGDLLILYTDGITEAQNSMGDFFEEERLLDVALSRAACTAGEIQNALLGEVHRFVGGNPRQDDIALVVIKRNT